MSTPHLYSERTLGLPDGVEIRYTDSGAPNTLDYTTMVFIHGTGFNGYGFTQLHEYASRYNLRIIICNRRDYHGSTKYDDQELVELAAGSKTFQDKLGLQMAWFLEHFIKHEATPKVSPDRRTGGFLLVGWSFGNAATLALLADPSVIPPPVYQIVEPYLRSLVLYDPPSLALGYPSSGIQEKYDVLADPDCTTPDQFFKTFQNWVTSYYEHPDIAGGLASGVSFEKCSEKKTIDRWTPEEILTLCEKDAAIRTDIPAFAPPMQATLRAQAHMALFDQDTVATFFPRVNIFYIAGNQTCSYCIWAYMESSRLYAEALGRARSTKFKLLSGGNHFLHCDAPEQLVLEIIEGCAPECA